MSWSSAIKIRVGTFFSADIHSSGEECDALLWTSVYWVANDTLRKRSGRQRLTDKQSSKNNDLTAASNILPASLHSLNTASTLARVLHTHVDQKVTDYCGVSVGVT